MTSIEQIEAMLARYVPLAKEIMGKDLTLERMVPLMEALGNPQQRLKIIHIAGTSGKTSTAYFMASLLTQSGRKVGLTVSPHVDTVLERVQINLQPLSEQDFAASLAACIEIIEQAGVQPTYFELLIGFAYWYFAKAGVDYAVIETGLGGLQDGTNIANNPDKFCIITDIGLDHMHVLGNTVPEISRQKAGIIHDGNEVLMYRQDDEVMEVFEAQAKQKHAALRQVDQNELAANENLPIDLTGLPVFQQRNWLLAQKAYQLLAERDNLPLLNQEHLVASMQVQVPGRMDKKLVGNKQIIMDGAHNEQKTVAFVDSFQRSYPGKQVPVLLSLNQGKEFAAVLPALKPITSKLIITSFAGSQDLPVKSIDTHELAAVATKFGYHDVVAEPDQDRAYELLLNSAGEHAVITGSFYLLGQLRSTHKELKNATS